MTAETVTTPPAPPQPTGDVPGPSGPLTTAEQRNWAMGAHLSALLASAFLGLAVLGPLVVWLVKRDDDAYVAAHAREALNFQLTWLIGGFVGGVVGLVLALVTFGLGLVVLLPLALVALVAWFVLPIRAAIEASNGRPYRYPLTWRLVH